MTHPSGIPSKVLTGVSREIADLVREIFEAEPGATVRSTSNGHLRVATPQGDRPVILPGTPSDHRSIKNSRSEVRRVLKVALRTPSGRRRGPVRIRRSQVEQSLAALGPSGGNVTQVWKAVQENDPSLGDMTFEQAAPSIRDILRTLANKGRATRLATKERRDGYRASWIYVHIDAVSTGDPQEVDEESAYTEESAYVLADEAAEATPVDQPQKTSQEQLVEDVAFAVELLLSYPLHTLEVPECVDQISRLSLVVKMARSTQKTTTEK